MWMQAVVWTVVPCELDMISVFTPSCIPAVYVEAPNTTTEVFLLNMLHTHTAHLTRVRI